MKRSPHMFSASEKTAVVLAVLIALATGPIGLLVLALLGVVYYLHVNRGAEEEHARLNPIVLKSFSAALDLRERPNHERIRQLAWDLLNDRKFQLLTVGMAVEARKRASNASRSDQDLIGTIQSNLLIDLLLRDALPGALPAWLCGCGGFNTSTEPRCSACKTPMAAGRISPAGAHKAVPILTPGPQQVPICPACNAPNDASAVFCGRCGVRLAEARRAAQRRPSKDCPVCHLSCPGSTLRCDCGHRF